MSENPLDPGLFRSEAIPTEVRAFNEAFLKRMAELPSPTTRSRDNSAPSPFPAAPKSSRARVRKVLAPGGREVEVRIIPPASGTPRGAYLHFHGGGLVFGSADQDDAMLERIANATGLAAVSVEYRLAPAHPYPAAWDDCEAAAVWLARNVATELGGSALAIGGESAGATLAVPVLVRMRDKHGFTGFRAANLSYGNYDTSMTPSQHWVGANRFLIGTEDIRQCSNAYAPDVAQRRNPDMSALYAELSGMPPALFSVGTLDPFLDDSLFVYARWIAAGNEAELAVYPGAPHGFNIIGHPHAAGANARIDAFLRARTHG
ncbi:MAG TPA: alpha/beta hydrolase [Steroidobacteraceae bacterium]|nr:alpha/beta hydrolase [Steroidobacteraceae bacterium]